MSVHSERARQWVHMGSGAFALLLRFLTWWQAAGLAVVALAFNALLLPRIGGRRLYRPVDEARGFPVGILLYPLAVLALIVTFPSRLDIAAASWAILAVGDGVATLVGRHLSPGSMAGARGFSRANPVDGARGFSRANVRWPWNPDKSVAGTAAFVFFGGAAAVLLEWWTSPSVVPRPSLLYVIAAPAAAALVAGLVETIPIGLDDNVSVPATAAAAMWMIALMSRSSLASSRDFLASTVPWAIAVNAVVSWLGYRARTVTLSGMLGGAVVGAVIYAGGGGGAWLLLLLTFATATVASKLGLKRKVLLGIAEERGGRRGAGNAFANCGVAAVAAIAAVTTPYRAAALLALVTALVAGGSDTVASEIGKAWGRATFLVTSLGRVKPGTPGAMSLEGTAAGIVAALALAVVAVALDLIPAALTLIVVASATAGALVESALGATLEAPGILNNDMLNFINTAVAATLALALA